MRVIVCDEVRAIVCAWQRVVADRAELEGSLKTARAAAQAASNAAAEQEQRHEHQLQQEHR